MPYFPSTQIIQMNSVTNTGTTGQVWWNGTHLYMNIGGTNYQMDQQLAGSAAHQYFSGSAPIIAAGTGAGTSPSGLSVAGVDNGGTVSLTTGTLPSGANATIATITYATSFPTSTAVCFTPANSTTASLSASGSVYGVGTASGFTIMSGSTALVGSTAYKWNYVVVGW